MMRFLFHQTNQSNKTKYVTHFTSINFYYYHLIRILFTINGRKYTKKDKHYLLVIRKSHIEQKSLITLCLTWIWLNFRRKLPHLVAFSLWMLTLLWPFHEYLSFDHEQQQEYRLDQFFLSAKYLVLRAKN